MRTFFSVKASAKACVPALILLLSGLPASQLPLRAADTAATANAPRSFKVRGILHAIDPEQKSITVEHEDIPGFMPAMTMPFYYKDEAEVSKIPIGSGISFRFVVTDDNSWVTDVEAINAEKVKRATAPKPSAKGTRVREGDRIPEFHLVDQDGKPVTRERLEGRAAVVTFIFTRCPVPNFCPLMSSRFTELQERVSKDATVKEKLHLLSISFDPKDTPEILTTYAKHHSADPALWTHASGTAEEAGKLTKAFSVYVLEESGTYSHGLCTALIDERGTIVKMWRGNDWEVDEVWKAIKSLP